MPEAAPETAYYLNLKARVVAVITRGLRLPAGRWIRVADATALAWLVAETLGELFPALKGRPVTFATLTSELEVKELERSFPDLG